VGPTNIVYHQIGCLDDVLTVRKVGDGEGGEKDEWEKSKRR
jgi:hypothetical protein